MSIKDQLIAAMTRLGQEPDVRFLGYNVRYGGKAGGTLNGVPEDKLEECPLAENLMSGAAIGFSLDGLIPVLFFERMDFILCGLDAIVNHLNHIARLSEGQHKPAVIIRICVGNKGKPLYTGATHTQDMTEALRLLVSFPVISLWWSKHIEEEYVLALARARTGVSTALIEYKDQI